MAKVVGNVVATRKEESLVGYKLLIVRRINVADEEKDECIAADYVGAGIGDYVIIGQGSAVRVNPARQKAAVDVAVIGIIDSFDS